MANSLIRTLVAAAACLCPLTAQASTPPPASTPLVATRVTVPPTIDGALDDEAWRGEPQPVGEWRSYNPLRGDSIPQQTRVWIAYDDRYLYFAFQCDDQEPERIKASVARRDTIFSDDWVGLSLDALGTGQVSYHMMVNPVGVQLDMLNSVSGDEDLAPDWNWDSAGRLHNPTGYSVEIRLPLESIRFTGGDNARMGILFWRRVSRIGVSVSWPAMAPAQWVFDVHAGLLFNHLEPRLARELIPTATYSRSRSRELTPGWSSVIGSPEAGLSARVGLTSTTSLDATVNPDFSQVESDAFQVEVNQRFPVFYSEKRPFFMQGSDVFKLAGLGSGDASMFAAVHTRRIIDPIAGAKVTGTLGRFTFGTLNASDEAPGDVAAEGEPGHGQNRQFNIARLQYGLGPSSFAGAIVTDTRFAGDDNQVVGGDLALKIGSTQRLTGMVLQSWSDRRGARSQGVAIQADYSHSTQRSTQSAQFEHYDPDFAMDTAFYTRVGFTGGWGYLDYNLDPDKTKYPWIRRISPFTFLQRAHDRIQHGEELTNVTGVRLNFTRQGFLRLDGTFGREPWVGREYPVRRFRTFGSVQLFRWLSTEASFVNGSAIYYDPDNPYAGRDHTLNAGVTLQPTGRFTEDLSFTHEVFDRADDGRRVYALDIVNSRTTYQFTRFIFVRGTVQYDSSRARVLTDFLASYEMRPGSVLYAGYGSLIERRADLDGTWTTGVGPYLTTQRSLFLKASYLYRF